MIRSKTIIVIVLSIPLFLSGCRLLFEEELSSYSLEYTYSQNGSYTTEEKTVTSESGEIYTLFYPADNTSNRPVIFWGNGSNETFSTYSSLLHHFASWGFIVVGNNDTATGTGESIIEMAKTILQLNETSDSEIYKWIDPEKVGLAGHSQGAGGATNAATRYEDSSIFKSLSTAALPQVSVCDPEDVYDISKISIPIFMAAGTEFLDGVIITPEKAMNTNLDGIIDSPHKVMSRRKFTDHNEIQNEKGGALGAYFTAWFIYTLTNNSEVKSIFEQSGELSENANWIDTRIEI